MDGGWMGCDGMGKTYVDVDLAGEDIFCLLESIVSRQLGTRFDFVEAGGYVGGCVVGFGADRVEVGGDVWRAVGGEGDVFVAGAFVDCEGDEVGGGHCVGGWLEG
jgi:hypothetical protein